MKKVTQTGISLVELVVTLAVLMSLVAAILFYFNPIQSKKTARDEKRLADIQTLDRVISEYIIDNGAYPAVADTLFVSNILPEAGIAPLTNPLSGWLNTDLTAYTSILPIDPINDSMYYYSYIHNNDSYEINTTLEELSEHAQGDGGNDSAVYEIGTDLTLL